LKGFAVEFIHTRRIIYVAVAILLVAFHPEDACQSKTNNDRDNGNKNEI
jgi:hypothetical protein